MPGSTVNVTPDGTVRDPEENDPEALAPMSMVQPGALGQVPSLVTVPLITVPLKPLPVPLLPISWARSKLPD